MKTPLTHIIQQQKIEIQFENFYEGIGIQNDIKDIFYDQLLPKMEVLFDEITGEGYCVSIEQLEIDCGALTSNYWKEEFVEETMRRLREELIVHNKKEIKNSEIDEGNNQSLDLFQAFLFFLKKGYLPWNSHIESIEEFEETVSEKLVFSKTFPEQLKDLFKKEPAAIERLLNSFSKSFFQKIAKLLAEGKIESIEDILFFIAKLTGGKEHVACSVLLNVLSNNYPDPVDQFHSLITRTLEGITIEKQTNQPGKKRKEAEGIYIQNAGLVILHPFLPELFTRLKLVINKGWKDTLSQHAAVKILEFLVSGKEEFAEFNVPLNKVLCGLDIDEVLEPVDELHSSVKLECEDLLSELIGHWSILKNTSIEGLRETFLQRNGKLSKIESGWLLNVEQKGVDVLLNNLPWGIGVIRLPWVENILSVEWI